MEFSNNQRAQVLVQALPYIKKYAGKTVVVKYGGNAMIDEGLKNDVMNDIVLMQLVGINVVLVHGGGPEINVMLKKIQKESKFLNGMRVTDQETMDIVQQVLAGKVNKDLVQRLEDAGGKAVGLCGLDGSLLKADQLDTQLGFVGEIREVNAEILQNASANGYVPIVSTVAAGVPWGGVQHQRRRGRRPHRRLLGGHEADFDDGRPGPAAGQGRRKHPHPRGERQRRQPLEEGGHYLRRDDTQNRLLRGRGAPGRGQGPYHRRADAPLHLGGAVHRRGHRHHVLLSPWPGPWPDKTCRARRFRAAELGERRWLISPRLGLGETMKSFVHLFKGGGGCGGNAPAALVASDKRRRVEKASGGRLFVGNPRRGFPDGIVDATRPSMIQPTLPAKACAVLWHKRAGRATMVPSAPAPGAICCTAYAQ